MSDSEWRDGFKAAIYVVLIVATLIGLGLVIGWAIWGTS